MSEIRIGAAVEYGTQQYNLPRVSKYIDFIEYGAKVSIGIPGWVAEMKKRYAVPLHLHPLDINLAEPAWEDEWCEKLARLVRKHKAKALVSDAGFWYLGSRTSVWPRPPALPASAKVCRDVAAHVAKVAGVSFRIENPPFEWLPGRASIWRYLDEATAADGVEICLDISHLRQFQYNVHYDCRRLPKSFPWHRVKEIHLAGYIMVEYLGRKRCLDQHVAEIQADQLELMLRVMEKIEHPLDICLEMEPRSLDEFERSARRVAALLKGRDFRAALC